MLVYVSRSSEKLQWPPSMVKKITKRVV